MISDKENTRLSKTLSYVLRHNPADIGIILDENGWTDVSTLLTKLTEKGDEIDINMLQHIVTSNAKQRFAFSKDGQKIRANQGHSVEVQLDYAAKQPPEFLYHGTVERFIEPILKEGLQKMDRHHVHLSAETETAVKVGQRRGKPVVLKIAAAEMYAQGYAFYISNNNVWLTDAVPPQFISTLQ